MGEKMAKKKKGSFEFRYYEVPADFPILALLGEGWVRAYEFGNNLHFHSQLEIGYCYWGSGELLIEDRFYPFSGGNISFIPKNVPHATNCDNGLLSKWEYLFIDIEEFMKMLYPNDLWYITTFSSQLSADAFCLHEKDYPMIAQLVKKIMNEMRTGKHYYKESVKGLLMALFVEISRLDATEELGITPHIDKNNAIAPALKYISINYMIVIKIETLSQLCHMSETHFRRIFEDIMQMKPLEYINIVRIRMSCLLLRSTDNSILNVAIKCGFPTITTYNRNFNKIVGMTPLVWRNTPSHVEKDLKNYKIMKLPGWV
jgi:AraC-like DNA-binding protein